ncbi:hypothetical protein Ccar_01350 [Clostridium carboxidivorans P7]|uniref:hypothetical protein n=1 Tax=Clostridium carboxidivorans TaxID=217159 RepID=UPI0001D39012|nr:hypothetical protein [Clostridium carboxidivorans]AKN29560.1 hypothetical protein Ccar_01350 [Clostridium carboxidivorans P7]EFG89514.1 hypothetical protein CLCAR_0674 [Clostridium carboxidivorans P7]
MLKYKLFNYQAYSTIKLDELGNNNYKVSVLKKMLKMKKVFMYHFGKSGGFNNSSDKIKVI